MRFSVLLLCFILCYPELAEAQLCNGNLGDPVIDIRFGNGPNDSVPPNFTTYQQNGGCPDSGQYAIANLLFGCQDNTWFLLAGDHYYPGDVDGNYMVVNAASTPGIIFTDTLHELCGNTAYQFAAWITNVMENIACGGRPVRSSIDFTVETLFGDTLATYNTGEIQIGDSKVWNQYGLTFEMPQGDNDVIVIISTKPQKGCGSSFAIDDITFSECGPATITTTIDGTTAPQNVCADYNAPWVMNVTYSPGFTDPVLRWQNSTDSGHSWNDIPGDTTSTYTAPHRLSGVIWYRVVMAERENINSVNCRTASNTIYTSVHPLIPHVPPQNIAGCISQDLVLPATDPSALQVLWMGPNGFVDSLEKAIVPGLQYADTGLYTRKELFYFGCSSLDSFYLRDVHPGIVLTAQPPEPVCEGIGEMLSVSASGEASFLWTPSTGLSNDTIPNPVTMPPPGTKYIDYEVMATNPYGCQDSAYLLVKVNKPPVANAGPDQVMLAGDSIVLNGIEDGTDVNYYWSPSQYIDNSLSITPSVYPPYNMSYTLNVVSTVGCGVATSEVSVKVYDGIFIPNAFTPNGDGKNDKFGVLPLSDFTLIELLIYNRWGELIFKAAGKYNEWDGTLNGMPQPTGAYVYYLELQDKKGKKITRQGTVLLLR